MKDTNMATADVNPRKNVVLFGFFAAIASISTANFVYLITKLNENSLMHNVDTFSTLLVAAISLVGCAMFSSTERKKQ